MYFNSFIAKDTLITLSDGKLKAVDKLKVGDTVQTFNQNAQNYDGAHLENNEQIPGIITRLGKKLIPESDTVKITLSNGYEIVVTKDYPLIGGGKSAGWQIYDAFMYVKNYKNISIDTIEELEEIIRPDVEVISDDHAGIHEDATEWYSSGQPPTERANTTKPGSMHPSGRQSGNFPGRLGVGKHIYCDDAKTLSVEEIVSLEELEGDTENEMYCVGWINSGHTIFANGICIGAGKSTAEQGEDDDPYKVDEWSGDWYHSTTGEKNTTWRKENV
ncbi:MAG: hypothetical protein H8E03_00875 [Pelagibacteraceae bacterium]|nr:hypothetical protein [Pelagibacteraceae bacterium]